MEATATLTGHPGHPGTCGNPDELTRVVGGLLAGVGPGGGRRAEWLRSLTTLEGMLAAARSRVLAVSPGDTAKRSAERSAELVRETGMSGTEARRAVRLADTLRAVPAAADALAEGRITAGHATVLSTGVSWLNRPAVSLDGGLLEAACDQSVDEFRATVGEWEQRENGDGDGRRLAARQHRRRRATWFTRDDGMVRIEADLAPDSGAMVTGALQALSEHLWRTEDGRTAGSEPVQDLSAGRTSVQRNADALEELARRATKPVDPSLTADGPQGAGRPRVDLLVTVDLERLQRTSGADRGRCTTADGVPLSPAAVRRLACDAGVVPVVLGGSSEVLDVGRRTRTIPTAVRNALLVRDGGCTFPGCDRAVSWCDAHHIVHWADGGPTSLENLVLLCSAHHHEVHDGDWTMEQRAGPDVAVDGWVFRSPVGREYPVGGT